MKLKSILAAAAMAVMGFMGTGSDAKAVTYILNDVTLSDGGTLSGFFTLNQYGGFSAYSLTTTNGTLLGGLPGQTYNYSPTYPPPAARSSPNNAPDLLVFFPNANPYTNFELQLAFSGNLLTGANLLGGPNSFECQNSFFCYLGETGNAGSIRYVDAARLGGGNLTLTPLPSALLLFGTALTGLGIFGYRRKATASADCDYGTVAAG